MYVPHPLGHWKVERHCNINMCTSGIVTTLHTVAAQTTSSPLRLQPLMYTLARVTSVCTQAHQHTALYIRTKQLTTYSSQFQFYPLANNLSRVYLPAQTRFQSSASIDAFPTPPNCTHVQTVRHFQAVKRGLSEWTVLFEWWLARRKELWSWQHCAFHSDLFFKPV